MVMEHTEYYAANNEMVRAIDREFRIVNVVGQEDGGFMLSIYDTRTSGEVLEEINSMSSNKV